MVTPSLSLEAAALDNKSVSSTLSLVCKKVHLTSGSS